MPRIYDGPIIDAHHHLWDLGLQRHPWLAAGAGELGGLGDLETLKRNYLPADYRRDAARQNVVATVHVEAGWAADDCVGRNALAGDARQGRRRRGALCRACAARQSRCARL